MYALCLPEELHDPLVLPGVLVPLQQEHERAPVVALNAQLARALLRRDHLKGENIG